MKPIIHLDRLNGTAALIGWSGEVNTFAELPLAGDHTGEYYMVLNATGSRFLFNYKASGLYRSTGSVWEKINNAQLLLNTDQFIVIDSADTTKGLKFDLSGLTTATLRTATWQDKDGTVAFLSDIIDQFVRVSASDTVSGYLQDKIPSNPDFYMVASPPPNQNWSMSMRNKNLPVVSLVDPTVNDDITVLDGLAPSQPVYRVGQVWVNYSTTPSKLFIAKDLSAGAAIWDQISTLDSNGTLTLNGGLVYGTSETVNIIANTNDLVVPNIEKVILVRLNPSGNFSLTGIVPPDITKATQLIIANVGTGNVIMKNNDIGSSANNRLLIGADRTMQSDEGIALIYDPISLRWRSSSINI